jgi:hypothetical protein
MDTGDQPDPFGEAITHGIQRVVQIAYGAFTAAQIYLHHQRTQAQAAAERDERARRALQAQIRADRDAARTGWAPALDAHWLGNASLRDTARAWGAAMPYADRNVPWYEPTAATALRKAEERLRHLHPHAMARYDRLRADAMIPADAMREAAPFFARPTRVYDQPTSPRYQLRPMPDRGPTPAAEPGTAMSTTPGSGATGQVARAGRPWEHDFPLHIRDVLAATTATAATVGEPPSTGRHARTPRRPARSDQAQQ